MGSRPFNLAVRFLLEMSALAALAYWGWQHDGALRFVLAIGAPLLAATLWAVFNVPHDPSRANKVPVPVPGVLRLLMELVLFAFATWALYDAGAVEYSLVFGMVSLVHYVVSYDRIAWLLRQR